VFKQNPGHAVDLFVGALGGKDRGNQQLKRVLMTQWGLDVRILGS
jgi:hypothetical protein